MLKFILWFTALAPVILAILFPFAWKYSQGAVRRLHNWKKYHTDKRLGVVLSTVAIAVLVAAAWIADVCSNYATATAIYREWPRKGELYLTQRVQRILNTIATKPSPTAELPKFQWSFTKGVVKRANRAAPGHFYIPLSLRKYFD